MLAWILHLALLSYGTQCIEQKDAGDLSSVVSAIGDTYEWPARFADLKRSIQPNMDILRKSWARLEESLEHELAEIQRRQHDIIPQVDFSEIEQHGGRFPEDLAAEIRKRGVVVVRNVVDVDLARSWKKGVKDYAQKNPSHVGFPKKNPQVLELYWSKPQLQARQHPNVHATMVALNHLYKSGSGQQHVSWDHVFTYGERLRIRQPGDGTFVLQPHTDGGSIERWEDPHYRATYAAILEGRWEEYSPWENGNERVLVNMTTYSGTKANGLSTIFRAFQGWLSLSAIGPVPDAGTLRVLPLLREATAHLLMRPFFEDVGAADFCGAVPGMAHDVTEKWHKRILQGLVTVPNMQPGDTVWWHPDIVHAVEGRHLGKEDSSVFYIPSVPLTVANAEYVRRQRDRFEQGQTPPDFPPNDSEMNFLDRGTEEDLTLLGRQLLGLEALKPQASCNEEDATCRSPEASSSDNLIARCNEILGFKPA